MLNLPITRLLNGMFALELLLIWGLATLAMLVTPVTRLSDSVLPAILSGGAGWCVMVWQGRRSKRHSSGLYWFGLWQLITCWAVFPLLKVIRQIFLPWSADLLLERWDKWLWFGESLPQRITGWQMNFISYTYWPTEFFAFCYASFYFLVIGSALFFFFQRHNPDTKHYFFGLMLMYLLGFMGYFSLPAAGPRYAPFTEFLYYPAGGAITSWLTRIVDKGVTGMDVFPSLHCGITLYITGFLYCCGYKRTVWLLSPVALGLIMATVYLHYHYGVDVIAGALLALWVLYFTVKKRQVSHATDLPTS